MTYTMLITLLKTGNAYNLEILVKKVKEHSENMKLSLNINKMKLMTTALELTVKILKWF